MGVDTTNVVHIEDVPRVSIQIDVDTSLPDPLTIELINVTLEELFVTINNIQWVRDFTQIAYDDSLAFIEKQIQDAMSSTSEEMKEILHNIEQNWEEEMEKLFQNIDQKWQETYPDLAQKNPLDNRQHIFIYSLKQAIKSYQTTTTSTSSPTEQQSC